MQGNNQQAYDRGTTIFSPNGRIYQVEYAREAVKQGAPVVGVRGNSALVLAAAFSRRSPLVDPESVEKLYTVDDHIVVGGAGHAADTRRLVDLARQAAQEERLRYDEPVTPDALATRIADHLQDHTQSGGARPYGSALLVGGFHDDPRLIEIDPSGSTREWRANAVGNGAADVIDRFETDYDAALTTDDALALALDGLDLAVDDLSLSDVDVVTVTADGTAVPDTDRLRAIFETDA